MDRRRLLRSIPQISKVVERFKDSFPEEVVKRVAREVTQRYRSEIMEGKRESTEDIFEEIERRLKERVKTKLRRVINATGVIISTNLGRAPLHKEVAEFVYEIATGYSNLEYDLLRGERGSRNSLIEDYLRELTGAEAGLVVNNNAGAVFLVLNTLAHGREVVVSRGELVEIGGGFRIPDIMRCSGAVLVEVGTTNRTRISDYESAISENTALLMKVHRSNFYMEGFVGEVSLEELISLGKRTGIPVYYDGGSGLLLDLGLEGSEVSMKRCVEIGADLVSGSGDKLLGGPQAGIIVGRKDLIDKMKKNPMLRCLRVDKMTLAGLEMTLKLYLEGRHKEIPVIRMLTESEETVKRRAVRLGRILKGLDKLEVRVIKERARPGGGSFPELELPTYCVSLKHEEAEAEELSKILRNSDPPVIGRIKEGRLLLDMRTVSEEEVPRIAGVLRSALGKV